MSREVNTPSQRCRCYQNLKKCDLECGQEKDSRLLQPVFFDWQKALLRSFCRSREDQHGGYQCRMTRSTWDFPPWFLEWSVPSEYIPMEIFSYQWMLVYSLTSCSGIWSQHLGLASTAKKATRSKAVSRVWRREDTNMSTGLPLEYVLIAKELE